MLVQRGLVPVGALVVTHALVGIPVALVVTRAHVVPVAVVLALAVKISPVTGSSHLRVRAFCRDSFRKKSTLWRQ